MSQRSDNVDLVQVIGLCFCVVSVLVTLAFVSAPVLGPLFLGAVVQAGAPSLTKQIGDAHKQLDQLSKSSSQTVVHSAPQPASPFTTQSTFDHHGVTDDHTAELNTYIPSPSAAQDRAHQ